MAIGFRIIRVKPLFQRNHTHGLSHLLDQNLDENTRRAGGLILIQVNATQNRPGK
jgi:hypothetical protein